MAELCGEPHQDHPEVTCDKPKPCMAFHQSVKHRMTWGQRELPVSQESNPMGLVEMARRIRRNSEAHRRGVA